MTPCLNDPPLPETILLVLKYRVPSLNRLFSMNHWQRRKEKQQAQLATLSALKAAAADSSTPIISVGSKLWTAYDTLASYMATARTKSTTKSAKSKSRSRKKEQK